MGAQDVHLLFHTAPGLCLTICCSHRLLSLSLCLSLSGSLSNSREITYRTKKRHHQFCSLLSFAPLVSSFAGWGSKRVSISRHSQPCNFTIGIMWMIKYIQMSWSQRTADSSFTKYMGQAFWTFFQTLDKKITAQQKTNKQKFTFHFSSFLTL